MVECLPPLYRMLNTDEDGNVDIDNVKVLQRAKKYQVISGGPLNSRLHKNLLDTQITGGKLDNILVRIACTSLDNFEFDLEDASKIRDYYFVGMGDDTVMFPYINDRVNDAEA